MLERLCGALRPVFPGIWQATLGSEAVVFSNHPACMSEDEAFQPGFWRGNRCSLSAQDIIDRADELKAKPEDPKKTPNIVEVAAKRAAKRAKNIVMA